MKNTTHLFGIALGLPFLIYTQNPTAFSGRAAGPALPRQPITSQLVNKAADEQVTTFTLINADTDQPIRNIVVNDVLNLATLPTRNLNIRANTNPPTVGSVTTVLSGPQNRTQTESTAPYSLFGDNGGNFNAWTPTVGNYTLQATPYSGVAGGGTAGTPLTVSFTVTDNQPPHHCNWTTVTAAGTPRWVGVSVTLNNKMYVFGGFDNPNTHQTPKCEVYDPATDQWTYLADMPTAVTHAGVTTDGNKVYIAGGFLAGDGSALTDLLQIYDLSTNTWTTGPKLPTVSGGNQLVRVGRTLHSFGGLLSNRQTNTGVHYVLNLTNTNAGWTTAAPMPSPRDHFAGVSLAGKIYAIGGQFGHDGPIQDADLVHAYDPTTDSWAQLGNLPHPRSHFEPGTFTVDGKITIVGGRINTDSRNGISNHVTEYTPAADTWTQLAPLPVKLFGPAAEVIHNELIVSHGSLNMTSDPQTTTYKRCVVRTPNTQLGFSPSALSLSIPAGGKASKKVLLWTINGRTPYTVDASTVPSWLSITPAAGTAEPMSTELTLTANATGLSAGSYTAQVKVKAAGYTDAILPITLTVGGTGAKVLYLYGTVPPSIHDMKLADQGPYGMSQYKQALIEVGLNPTEALDASLTLDAATLNQYKVLILSSNNRRFTNAERAAVASWVTAGGGLVAWSDAAFGWQSGGINNLIGATSDNDLMQQFGMQFLRDNGATVFPISQWETDHYINKFNRNGGLLIEAEGVSPVRTSPPATIIATLPAGQKLNNLDGPRTAADAALATAKIGQGRVAGFFDRNAFWNAGDGSQLSKAQNKEFAQRLVLWASGVTDNPPTGTQSVVSLSLMNADTEQPIRELVAGDVLNLNTLPTTQVNIRANTNPSTVGSVVMVLSGPQSRTQTETSAPYALFGNNGSDYTSWTPAPGSYTLTATPYTAAGGNGAAGNALTINFTVTNSGARVDNHEVTKPGSGWQVYPNPTRGIVRLAFDTGHALPLTIEVVDLLGRSVVHLRKDDLEPVQVDLTDLSAGLYFIRLQSADGTISRKLLKQ